MLSRFLLALLLLPLLAACDRPADDAAEPMTGPSLKAAYGEAFDMGVALNPAHHNEQDTQGVALVKHHFNAITPENVMKWALIHPEQGRFAFEEADAFVAFGEANDMVITGHTLVWHSQTPSWVFEDGQGNPASRDTLLARMERHIQAVAGRYRGRVEGWDVVNEALNEDGTLRDSPWRRIIGDDYLEYAFRFAHEADPDAKLYYNDYSLENKPKRDGAVRLVRSLQEAGVPIHGIGTQMHAHMAWPTVEQVDSTLAAFAELGIDVMVTELDIAVLPRPDSIWGADVNQRAEMRAELNPYTEGLPDSVSAQLAHRYAGLFQVFLQHQESLTRVTLWGVTDGDSWLNNWPIPGRTSYPLLFDRAYQPKAAFDAVMQVAPSQP